ncbi:MAG: dephospho-CoA kinase [Candidatus Obscuribacter sp.]|nr:dephospho-CoA kinase [Candidatus Obscuribacter sp.]
MQTEKDKPIRLGITGTIASGKSAVGRILALRGIAVIDTDRVVHDLLTYDETTKKAIVQEFGESVLSNDPVPGDKPDMPGSKHARLSPIDRKILGSIVFHSESKRRKLEAIIHPNVILSCRRRVAELGNQQLIAILVPLLFEANLEGEYDVIW